MNREPELTRGQHFQFGFVSPGEDPDAGARLRRERLSQNDLWTVRYGRASRIPMNFRFECLEATREIHRRVRGPIDVLFSGGIDSEVAVRSFVEAGIPIRAAILRFKNDLNLHDYAWAVIACEKLGVPFRIHELDLLEFWTNQGLIYADRTQCVSPQLLPTMWLADQIDGFPVIGSGENYLVRNNSTWSLMEKERIASWYRHFLVQGREACPGFYQWSPELMLAWLLEPTAIDLWSGRRPLEVNSLEVKYRIYREHFNVQPRPKYHGFERVRAEESALRLELTRRFPHSDQVYGTPVHRLLELLSPVGRHYTVLKEVLNNSLV